MRTVQITDKLSVDLHDAPVLVSVSGGADSALLLYILLKETSHTLHVSSLVTFAKKDIVEPILDRVITNCIDLTGNNNIVRHSTYKDKQIPSELELYSLSIIKENNLALGYNGVTSFPPDAVIDNFYENMKESDAYAYGQRKHGVERAKYFSNKKLYRPFINNTKQDIADAFRKLDIEQLFPLTRSCENIYSPDKHCGECFWCQERCWGFGYLE